ncbi:ATP12 family chaperone protein [Sinisalibacter aestuarii]|uniref:ATPase n=1 Tax=Sinisalibacter aestuarii TaxID=2949426 RepID=A0ABQ5LW14_9RHOB|nr:ATP12 family protein [Sinisalibacter aestuarii]GKY89190.1 ATPase [Sinisalibacter aestuarii]
MSEWKLKRFWTETAVREADGGYCVTLDGRSLRTPAKAPQVMPSRALAEAVAAEWAAQTDEVRPDTMPLTRTVNSAIDKLSLQHDEVAALLAAYGETDHICYRATGPDPLVARQAAAWDPLLDWAEAALGARLVVVSGVIPAPQDPAALERLAARTRAFDPFELAAFHDLVTLSGSLVLAFAAVENVSDPETIWAISRIDEAWQAEQWGEDEEAAEHAALKKQAFLDAMRVFSLLRQD